MGRGGLVPAERRDLATRSASLVRRGLKELEPPHERTLRFPEDRSLGTLTVYPEDPSLRDVTFDARGAVSVPIGATVELSLHREACADLSPLANLRPHDLQRLWLPEALDVFDPEHPEPSPLTDQELAQVGRLVGLEILVIQDTYVTDAGLAHLRSLSALKDLTISAREEITDSGLQHLRHLLALRSLSLFCTGVTGSGLQWLSALPDLRSLSLSPRIADEHLSNLRSLKSLERLHCDSTNITSKGLALLSPLTSLRALGLGWTGIDDASLRHLQPLQSLQELSLCGTEVGDVGLRHLVQLRGLRELWLGGTNVTDAGLVHLRALTGLRELGLQGTQVTDAGLADLRLALPTCRIVGR